MPVLMTRVFPALILTKILGDRVAVWSRAAGRRGGATAVIPRGRRPSPCRTSRRQAREVRSALRWIVLARRRVARSDLRRSFAQ